MEKGVQSKEVKTPASRATLLLDQHLSPWGLHQSHLKTHDKHLNKVDME